MQLCQFRYIPLASCLLAKRTPLVSKYSIPYGEMLYRLLNFPRLTLLSLQNTSITFYFYWKRFWISMDIFLLKARKHYWVGSSTLGSSQLIFDKFAYITLFCFSVGTEAFLSLSDLVKGSLLGFMHVKVVDFNTPLFWLALLHSRVKDWKLSTFAWVCLFLKMME